MEDVILTDVLIKLDGLIKEYRSKFGYNGREIEMKSDDRFISYWHNQRKIFFYDRKNLKFVKNF